MVIVDALLQFRELAKLKSTYLDALPPLVRAVRLLHVRELSEPVQFVL